MPDDLRIWRDALAAEDPVHRLRALAQERLSAGDSRELVVEQLTRLVHQLREEQRPDGTEDPILDVLDMFAGWCAPGSAL
jgi:hypothetical protein